MPRFTKKPKLLVKRKKGGNPILAGLVSAGVVPLVSKIIDKIWPDKKANGRKRNKKR